MCSKIDARASTYVNLVLNPERNTGYNGAAVWKLFYQENCFQISKVLEKERPAFAPASDAPETCHEEAVLYRLLSGMHASTTLSRETCWARRLDPREGLSAVRLRHRRL